MRESVYMAEGHTKCCDRIAGGKRRVVLGALRNKEVPARAPPFVVRLF